MNKHEKHLKLVRSKRRYRKRTRQELKELWGGDLHGGHDWRNYVNVMDEIPIKCLDEDIDRLYESDLWFRLPDMGTWQWHRDIFERVG